MVDVVDVSVLLPTIPEREHTTLPRATGSLSEQTVRPVEVLIGKDLNHAGPVGVVNRLARASSGRWLFPFADDDVLYPHHFETLEPVLAALEGRAQVVYSWCRVTGRIDVAEDRFQRRVLWPEDFTREMRQANFVPACACIARELWEELGGYREPGPLIAHEDWDFWLRALKAGARFECVPVVTWEYRISPAWRHRSDLR